MTTSEFMEKYRITRDRRAAYCVCGICAKGCHYVISAAKEAVEHDAPLQCPNCQAYEVMPMRTEAAEC